MKGIDISNLNGYVNIASVKSAGYGFIISKITEGTTYIDKYGNQNIASTKVNGLIAGAYHFARFRNKADAIKEAEFFKENCPSNVDFVVLDFEQQCNGDMTDACLAFLNSISSIAPAIIYCNPNYVNVHLNSNITKYPLWIAHYGVPSPSVPKWGNYAIWQYSEHGKVNGISGDVDLNISNDSIFLNFIKKSIPLQQPNSFCTYIDDRYTPILDNFVTSTDNVICKDVPDNNGKTNGTIVKAGTQINIYAKCGEWYLINNATPQYVAIEFTKSKIPLNIIKKVQVNALEGARCYENPSKADPNNGVVPQWKELNVYKQIGNFYLVNGDNQHLQWIDKDDCSDI